MVFNRIVLLFLLCIYFSLENHSLSPKDYNIEERLLTEPKRDYNDLSQS